MKKLSRPTKLALATETVRSLSLADLTQVQGGLVRPPASKVSSCMERCTDGLAI